MKTTIDIAEQKLVTVMRMTGARSRKAAVDQALTCLERAERLRRLFEKPLADEVYRDALDPAYDLRRLRAKDKPAHVARLSARESFCRPPIW
jgi:Arc/MetJ family transcription regulator